MSAQVILTSQIFLQCRRPRDNAPFVFLHCSIFDRQNRICSGPVAVPSVAAPIVSKDVKPG